MLMFEAQDLKNQTWSMRLTIEFNYSEQNFKELYSEVSERLYDLFYKPQIIWKCIRMVIVYSHTHQIDLDLRQFKLSINELFIQTKKFSQFQHSIFDVLQEKFAYSQVSTQKHALKYIHTYLWSKKVSHSTDQKIDLIKNYIRTEFPIPDQNAVGSKQILWISQRLLSPYRTQVIYHRIRYMNSSN